MTAITVKAKEPAALVDVRPPTAARLADFLEFFDGDAFADNPKWASCYCQCFCEDQAKIRWNARTASESRAAACRRVGDGTMRGFLAYCEGRVVGWCNAAPRPLLHALDREPISDGAQAGTILCFLVVPAARQRSRDGTPARCVRRPARAGVARCRRESPARCHRNGRDSLRPDADVPRRRVLGSAHRRRLQHLGASRPLTGGRHC